MGDDRTIKILQARIDVLEAEINLLNSKVATIENGNEPMNNMLSSMSKLLLAAGANNTVTTLVLMLLGQVIIEDDAFGVEQAALLKLVNDCINKLPEHIVSNASASIEMVNDFWGEH